jgi:hypothetical protein
MLLSDRAHSLASIVESMADSNEFFEHSTIAQQESIFSLNFGVGGLIC